jgi:glycosyltransferase involved in cell wall biosynthesis
MPHFVWEELQPNPAESSGDYALFVGRLDPEKGVRTLLEAWRYLDFPLRIRGTGLLDKEARKFIMQHDMNHVQFVGRLEEAELSKLIRNARFLVLPSEGYYETFGMVIIEAYSRGVPVVASNIGVIPELVTDEKTGLLFEAGNAVDLANKARWMRNHPQEAKMLGKNGLNSYKDRFTPEQCYRTLLRVYDSLVG